MHRLPFLFLLAVVTLAQPPAIFQDGVSNAASGLPTSLPFGGLAPGSRVVIHGVRFEHPKLIIRSNSTSYTATTLKASDRVAEFLLPRQLPLGPAQLIVDADSGSSHPFPVTITANGFGIRGIRGTAPHTLTIEGTGLGTGEIEVVIGGKPLRPLKTQTREAGDDRIEVRLPPTGVPIGCHLPLYVRTKSHISNVVDLPSLPGCADEPWPILAPQPGGVGSLLLARSSILLHQGPPINADSAYGVLATTGKPMPQVPLWFPLTAGQCRWEFSPAEGAIQDPLRMLRLDKPGLKAISAGGFIALGNRRIPLDSNGIYKTTLGGNTPVMRRPKPLFYVPGQSYAMSAPEDSRSPFAVSLTFVDDLELSVPATAAIDRGAPFVVTWRTSQPQVAIVLYSQNDNASIQTICAAKGSDGQFTVPPDVLRSLPPTLLATGSIAGYVGVAAISAATPFSTAGIKQGVASSVRLKMAEIEFR